jgi:hypothetical protein
MMRRRDGRNPGVSFVTFYPPLGVPPACCFVKAGVERLCRRVHAGNGEASLAPQGDFHDIESSGV